MQLIIGLVIIFVILPFVWAYKGVFLTIVAILIGIVLYIAKEGKKKGPCLEMTIEKIDSMADLNFYFDCKKNKKINLDALLFGLIGKDNIEMLQFVLAKGANVNAVLEKGTTVNVLKKEKSTPLIEASRLGFVETVEFLLDNGADVNLTTENGTSAISIAALNGKVATVELLLERGAEVKNALVYSVLSNRIGLIEILYAVDSSKADIALQSAAKNGKLPFLEALLKKGISIDITDANGDSLLVLAAKNIHMETIKYLLKEGIKIPFENEKSMEIITEALFRHSYKTIVDAANNNDMKAVEFFILHKDETAVKSKITEAFTAAATAGHAEIVKYLVPHK